MNILGFHIGKKEEAKKSDIMTKTEWKKLYEQNFTAIIRQLQSAEFLSREGKMTHEKSIELKYKIKECAEHIRKNSIYAYDTRALTLGINKDEQNKLILVRKRFELFEEIDKNENLKTMQDIVHYFLSTMRNDFGVQINPDDLRSIDRVTGRDIVEKLVA